MKLIITTLLAAAFLEGHALAKDSYITFIMDRSASMHTQRVDGKTRCAFSKAFTRQTLNKLYERYAAEGTVYINLELFGSQGGQQSLTQGFNKDRTQVLAAIDQLASEDCEQSSTALADAMCSAANGMRTLTAGLDSNLIVFGITDGEENSSSFRDCGPNLAAGWQDYIKAKFKNETPRIIYNAAIFTGENIRTQEPDAIPQQEIPRAATFQFLIELARETGGTVTVVNDQDSTPPTQFPVPELPMNSFQTVKFVKDSQSTCVDAAAFALIVHTGDNDLKRVDRVENDYLQTSLLARYQDCSVTVTCAQAPIQNLTALVYHRLCSSNSLVGDLDGKLMREFDANLNLY
ncbi:vWA domain-containing protein [Oligoflexus tunisiensis]|uniref:vWA domain-containing protein n=1 Tax=Oligoflexus tunisiensis TaxID=708132 RepID=UPI00114CF502|nr:VWA domain-containing protein [Oligoflexus tunisiensis]